MAALLPGEHRGEWIRVGRALTNSLSSSFSSYSQPALFMLLEHCKQVEMLSVCATPLLHLYMLISIAFPKHVMLKWLNPA